MKDMMGDVIEIYRRLRERMEQPSRKEVMKEGQSRQERCELRHNC